MLALQSSARITASITHSPVHDQFEELLTAVSSDDQLTKSELEQFDAHLDKIWSSYTKEEWIHIAVELSETSRLLTASLVWKKIKGPYGLTRDFPKYEILIDLSHYCLKAKKVEWEGNLPEAHELYTIFVLEMAIEAHLRLELHVAELIWKHVEGVPYFDEIAPHAAFHRQLWLNRFDPNAIEALYTDDAIAHLKAAAHMPSLYSSAYFYGKMLSDARYVAANLVQSMRYIHRSHMQGICTNAETQWVKVLAEPDHFPYEYHILSTEKLHTTNFTMFFWSRKYKSEVKTLTITNQPNRAMASKDARLMVNSALSPNNFLTASSRHVDDNFFDHIGQLAVNPETIEEILWSGKQFERQALMTEVTYSCGEDKIRFWKRNARNCYEIVLKHGSKEAQKEALSLLTKLFPQHQGYLTPQKKADDPTTQKKTAQWDALVSQITSSLATTDDSNSDQKSSLSSQLHSLSQLVSAKVIPENKIVKDLLALAVNLELTGHTDIAGDIYHTLQLTCTRPLQLKTRMKEIADQEGCKVAAFFFAVMLQEHYATPEEILTYLHKSITDINLDTKSPVCVYLDGFFKWAPKNFIREAKLISTLVLIASRLEINDHTDAAQFIYDWMLQKCTHLNHVANEVKKIADLKTFKVAAFCYALMLRTGKGVALDVTQSYHYFTLAADHKAVKAYLLTNQISADHFMESVLYEKGTIYTKNTETAWTHLIQAVKEHNPHAMVRLAKAYRHGYGSGTELLPVVQDKIKGMTLLRQVGLSWLLESGYTEEHRLLKKTEEMLDNAKMHLHNAEFFVKKYNDAFFLNIKQHRDNAINAYRLAIMAFAKASKAGIGEAADSQFNCLVAVAKFEEKEDIFNLAMAYLVQKNMQGAEASLKAAAAKGHADAAYLLGLHYESRQFVTLYPSAMASKYYRSAADKGHLGAKSKLTQPIN